MEPAEPSAAVSQAAARRLRLAYARGVRVVHYFDYKSPYAYLAQEATYALRDQLDADVEWLPYTLDIPSYLGRAQVDHAGQVLVDERNPHQWRRVRYSYMDCRREGQRRGLIIRGPRKIYDSSIANIAFLYARALGDPHAFHLAAFERFFKRELDVGDPRAVAELLEDCGFAAEGFPEYLAGEGRAEHDRIRAEAEDLGVFGVPSYLVGDQLFWGAERIPRVQELLRGG